ncbi:hypothetical protein HN419_02550 [Candidatus Woesearchaeota archaeon]|jgi:gamma-glutamyl:cysteine ligase YbdK (ATP-grasp superfamily)|nr:hypothetical protein [Candidatus Woesearchaeota archaeon]MBT3537123.1 hypothetical protein [Candidatus Woesearchaeota archaeon]MBT4696960.1 hypothetical protein [Candidatus Woesearchaeota archaeon]MBT7106567.1 hypothetical protein [Candidatus Woesearchaeota archaeon]MBT7931058.1 hypothetical protein [Candidatus Woesearchaeota archaeon]
MKTDKVKLVSNELEVWIDGISAEDAIAAIKKLPEHGPVFFVDPEVNLRDAMEINISKAKSSAELNSRAQAALRLTSDEVKRLGGTLYAGSYVGKSTKGLDYSPYRTTTLSVPLGQGLTSIAGHQILFGMADTKSASIAYETLRQLGPLVIALTASSPFSAHSNGETVNSSRIAHVYPQSCAELPDIMHGTPPVLEDVEDWYAAHAEINKELHRKFRNGELTIDERFHTKGFDQPSHLAPHQIYWHVRPRFDHATNGDDSTIMSLEYRIGDMPMSAKRLTALNSFIMGSVSEAIQQGKPHFFDTHVPRETLKGLEYAAAKDGLDATYNGAPLAEVIDLHAKIAERGITDENHTEMHAGIQDILQNGNDAARMRAHFGEGQIPSHEQIRKYAVEQFQG